MRIGMFSPLPPAASGIADYTAALLGAMRAYAQVEMSEGCDIAVYQIGNNPDHLEAYEAAIARPGIVVLHEANLHHLIAAATIRRGDWDAYLRECEFDGGPRALEFARRVRALEAGPDYDGVPMLRRLLEGTRGLIAHSDFVIERARAAGYEGPAARIPHGAWIPEVDRMAYRARLGLEPKDVLVGTFGHLKPYKRIPESLRAFRRAARNEPRLKMILAGELHPETNVHQLIETGGLRGSVRLLGRIDDIGDFTGYLAACDVVLNLRYPTVGETSGTLLRALGLARAVLVSDVGAFSEFPDEVCLKVPVTREEEHILSEYLQLLSQRRDLGVALGAKARDWVRAECSWERVASMYVSFCQCVIESRPWTPPQSEAIGPTGEPAAAVEPEYIKSWGGTPGDQQYIETHLTRFEKTLAITPAGGPEDRILEMGAYLQITPALRTRLGYGEVRGCYYGPAGGVDPKRRTSATGEEFSCDVDLFDAEKDRFPYEDGFFSTVLCCELVEHLPSDPMHMISEINRVLKDKGHLVITTPNISSHRAIAAILQGHHPGFFPAYLKPEAGANDARHNREYTPREVYTMLNDGGFTVTLLETGPFRDLPKPEWLWVEDVLTRYGLPGDLRGDGIYAVGRKTGPVRNRYPAWLYD
jgi:glycosyltransferase involved in cell wall biosynthesis/SAM-dependent methyltransferase